MAVNISDLSMCMEVDLAFYPAQHQHSKQWNNSVIEVKVNIPMTNKTVIALETWICSAQTRLCRLNQQGWQVAGLLATAHPATWARLIYGRLTRSLFQRVLALRRHYVLAFLNQRPQPAQNCWVFSVNIADFWHTFWVIWENGWSWSNLRLKMSVSALGRLKNHDVPHLHPNFTMFIVHATK